MQTRNIPVLDAYRYMSDRREVSLVVWCIHCVKWHWHGAGQGPGAGDGHRVAHCHDDTSPYNTGGYELREVGTIAKREMKQYARLNKRKSA